MIDVYDVLEPSVVAVLSKFRISTSLFTKRTSICIQMYTSTWTDIITLFLSYVYNNRFAEY
jgi:hypothetical protein